MSRPYIHIRRKTDSVLFYPKKHHKEVVTAFVPCPCCDGKIKKWSRTRKAWVDCVGCLKTPGKQPRVKFNDFDL